MRSTNIQIKIKYTTKIKIFKFDYCYLTNFKKIKIINILLNIINCDL